MPSGPSVALGGFRDRADLLRAAAAYLAAHEELQLVITKEN